LPIETRALFTTLKGDPITSTSCTEPDCVAILSYIIYDPLVLIRAVMREAGAFGGALASFAYHEWRLI
jgi:hypothetical protein